MDQDSDPGLSPADAGEESTLPSPAGGAGDGGELRGKRRSRIFQLTRDVELWHTPSREAYATLPIGNHFENWPLRSEMFKNWLRLRADAEGLGTLGTNLIESIVGLLTARAINDHPCHDTFLRVGKSGGHIYIDLADHDWRCVEIRPADVDDDAHVPDWRVLRDAPPCKFLRRNAMLELPAPAPGGSIELLRPFVNVAQVQDFQLFVGFLVASLRADGPYPILVVSGEQDTGKSSLLRLARRLIDPSIGPARAAPREERDLFVAARNNHVLSYDNLSGVADWLSDAFCRISTGGGFAARALHTDGDEFVMEAQRPIIMNGIADLGRRPDLADRTMVLRLGSIRSNRRLEAEYWKSFGAVSHLIMGALCDLLSAGLRNLDKVQLPQVRMADAVRFMNACSLGAGWSESTITDLMVVNRLEAIESILEGNPVAVALQRFFEEKAVFEGGAAALLGQLEAVTPERLTKSRQWPNSATKLGIALHRLAPALRLTGYEIEYGKSRSAGVENRRWWKIVGPPKESK